LAVVQDSQEDQPGYGYMSVTNLPLWLQKPVLRVPGTSTSDRM